MVEKYDSQELPTIDQALTMSAQGLPSANDEVNRLVQTLEAYECWAPFFRLLKAKIGTPQRRERGDYIRMARVYYLYLEDEASAGDICHQMIRDLNIPFVEFRDEISPQIIASEDFTAEAQLFDAILPSLGSRDDTIACLERLCLIYEKKKYDEVQLNQTYEKLVSLDPANLKALRYFKVIYTQNHEWPKVVRVLRQLYENSTHLNDRYRIAQELATVYLYQLDEPQAAIEVVESLCQGSPLDTTTIHYEAFYRLQNWQGCLQVLERYLAKLDSAYDQGIVFYKLGELEQMLGRPSGAAQRYRQSLRLAPTLLESMERLIELAIDQKDWESVLKLLGQLRNAVQKEHLQERIDDAMARVREGMQLKAT